MKSYFKHSFFFACMLNTKSVLIRALITILLLTIQIALIRGEPTTVNASGDCIPSWQVVSSPNISGYNNGLSAVAALALDDIWIGGYYLEGYQGYPLLAHWNGTQWTIIDMPDMPIIKDFYAAASNDIWAVGNSKNFLHWDGSTWQSVSTATYSETIDGTAGNDVWGIGSPSVTQHWDGTAWTYVQGISPDTRFELMTDIKAFAPDDVWAVGWKYLNGSFSNPLVTHWDGSSWTYQTPPFNFGNFRLSTVDGTSSHDLWAGGNESSYGEIAHWNGEQWSLSRGPLRRYDIGLFRDLHALTEKDVWLVGRTFPNSTSQPILGHWNGKRWNRIPNPPLNADESGLAQVSAVNSTEVWAVGSQKVNGVMQTLVLRATLPCYLPPAPKLRTPKDNAFFVLPLIQLNWGNAPTATHFKFQVRRDSVQGDIVLRGKTRRSEFLITNLDNGDYVWRVRACNGGGCGVWSPFRSFQVHSP